MRRPRLSSSIGAIPEPIDNKDTEPNLFGKGAESFEAPAGDSTVPRCFLCGRSSWDRDDAFEAGIAYALTQVHGLLQTRMEPAIAQALTDWMRSKIR